MKKVIYLAINSVIGFGSLIIDKPAIGIVLLAVINLAMLGISIAQLGEKVDEQQENSN